MTQEEKQLLLKDLCARLPYGFTIYRLSDNANIKISDINDFAHFLEYSEGEEFKPYLRPISSITQEEYKEFNKKYDIEYNYLLNGKPGHTIESVSMNAFEIDFYNSHHIDYRGLIEKGLALEAPEGMYKTE